MDLSTIHYLLREKYYGHALTKITKFFEQQANAQTIQDVHLNLLKSYCFCKLGKTSEAIRTLKRMDGKHPELQIAVLCALRIAYLNEATTDRESLKSVEASIQKCMENSDEIGYYVSTWLLIFEENLEKARSFSAQLPSKSSNPENMVLRAWIEILNNRDSKSALDLFDKSIGMCKSADAYLGKAKIFEIRRNTAEMKNTLSIMLSVYPSSLAAHIELVKTAAILHNWNEMLELTQKLSLIESNCIQSQIYEFIHAVAIGEKASTPETILTDLNNDMVAVEDGNSFINAKICSIIISLTIDNKVMLTYAKRFSERCLEIEPQNTDFILKKARLAYLENDTRKALQLAMSATEIDDGPKPFFHVIQCNIKLNNIEEAKSQLDFLKATHKSIQNYPNYLFIQAIMLENQGKFDGLFYDNIHQCIGQHLAAIQNLPFGIDYIERMDATFMTEIAEFLIDTVNRHGTAGRLGSLLKEAERILAFIYDKCPALSRPGYLLAKVKYVNKDFDEAEKLLRNCIEKDNSKAEAYLLLAQVFNIFSKGAQ